MLYDRAHVEEIFIKGKRMEKGERKGGDRPLGTGVAEEKRETERKKETGGKEKEKEKKERCRQSSAF